MAPLSNDKEFGSPSLANQFRLMLSSFAYVLMDGLRRLGLSASEHARWRVDTIRLKLMKIAARVRVTARRVVFHLSSHSPSPPPTSIDAKQQNIASELRIAMLQEAANQEPAVNAERSEESQVDLLKQIDVVIAQQKNTTSTLQDIQSKQIELNTELGRLANKQLGEGPPYSILMLKQLKPFGPLA
ncbi:transposase [Novipirellula artificiosorum]|uniref:Transposase DDE domain-containing protein n=1 Tax=Novipirellula artificiosorum TaxID=2528016 RepID=A0A5C6E1P3_9BACT|nr:transposase [Novipirellula artificiosorum]TWU42645.1 hypothetical protein Poly41_09440 [Novipirellula artificiosorum]